MKVSFPVTKPVDKLGKGFVGVQPGKYHFKVLDFMANETDHHHKLTLEVVYAEAHMIETEVGKEHDEYLWVRGKDDKDTSWAEALANLAIACGIMTPEEYEKHRKEGTAPDLDFEKDLPGCHCVGEIGVWTDKNGKERTQIVARGCALYHVNSPQAKSFPVLDSLLEADGIKREPITRADQDMSQLI